MDKIEKLQRCINNVETITTNINNYIQEQMHIYHKKINYELDDLIPFNQILGDLEQGHYDVKLLLDLASLKIVLEWQLIKDSGKCVDSITKTSMNSIFREWERL